jgi:hypothetical protein
LLSSGKRSVEAVGYPVSRRRNFPGAEFRMIDFSFMIHQDPTVFEYAA